MGEGPHYCWNLGYSEGCQHQARSLPDGEGRPQGPLSIPRVPPRTWGCKNHKATFRNNFYLLACRWANMLGCSWEQSMLVRFQT